MLSRLARFAQRPVAPTSRYIVAAPRVRRRLAWLEGVILIGWSLFVFAVGAGGVIGIAR